MKTLLLAASAALLGASGQPVFGWRDGAVYQVNTQPGRVTDIALQPGEALSGTAGVAAGDTVRWIIGESESGAGAARQVHVLVKPVSAGLSTNLVIATDRRVYHVELRATPAAYMAAVAWRYPENEIVALRGAPPAAPSKAPAVRQEHPGAPEPLADLSRLNFDYKVEGKASWRPERVFDDGRRTVIDLPAGVPSGALPPLFVLGPKGEDQLVNYRVLGHRIVVDGLFDAAELRMGAGRDSVRVRIVRAASAS